MSRHKKGERGGGENVIYLLRTGGERGEEKEYCPEGLFLLPSLHWKKGGRGGGRIPFNLLLSAERGVTDAVRNLSSICSTLPLWGGEGEGGGKKVLLSPRCGRSGKESARRGSPAATNSTYTSYRRALLKKKKRKGRGDTLLQKVNVKGDRVLLSCLPLCRTKEERKKRGGSMSVTESEFK